LNDVEGHLNNNVYLYMLYASVHQWFREVRFQFGHCTATSRTYWLIRLFFVLQFTT